MTTTPLTEQTTEAAYVIHSECLYNSELSFCNGDYLTLGNSISRVYMQIYYV